MPLVFGKLLISLKLIFSYSTNSYKSFNGVRDEFVEKCSLASLKVLGSVGEPINPEAWKWYYETVGKKKCPVIDTWCKPKLVVFLYHQSQNHALKPGSATLPFYGVTPLIVDNDGNELKVLAKETYVLKPHGQE